MRYKNKLDLAENMALCNFILAEYKNSKLNDIQFAEYANKSLNSTKITASHIGVRRGSLKIPSNVKRTVNVENSIETRISKLESKVKFLYESLDLKSDSL